MANKFEATLERWVFNSRWLLAPFFIGLLLAIAALLIKFVQAFAKLALGVVTQSVTDNDMIIDILTLVDGALIGALLLIIGFSGYENFVSKIGTGEHEDRPAWMGKVGFSDLKIKLMGAIVAISAVELLKACIAMGVTALVASGLESVPALAPSWLPIWVGAAIMACAVALFFMEEKAKAQGLSLRRAVARRFFMTLVPAFVAGGVLTAALV